MVNEKLQGVFAPISTPFEANGAIDYTGLAQNVRAYDKAGLKGFLALGSNGENKSLSNEEKLLVLETICASRGTRQSVMAGCIFESTVETIGMAKEMEAIGADFLTLLPPSYFKKQMTDDVLYRYFTDVAEAVSIPCLVYNAPQYAGGVGLSVSLIKRCAAHENIVGVKDSSTGNMENILFAVRDKMSVISGSITNFFTCMTMGGSGGVLSLANSFPEICVELYELLVGHKYDDAIALNEKLLRVSGAIGGAGGVAAVKYAMELHGLTGKYPRLPLLPLDEAGKKTMRDKLRLLGMPVD